MPSYTRPPGSEGNLWEDWRVETGGNDRPEDFQAWLVNRQMQGRYEDLSNFQSPYYQQFRSYLGKVTPTFGTHQALAGQVAGGSNYATGSVIAGERAKAFNRNREDFLNKTVSGFAFQSQGQANTLLGGLSQNAQFQQSLIQRRYEFDESQPDFWDTALAFAPPMFAFASNFFGGESGGDGYGPDDMSTQGGGTY